MLDGRDGHSRPADLYLEGGDQYRGWFQASLLTAIGAGLGEAPYKAVLTHGWTVDGEGKAMHKSLGNGVEPESIIKVYGADILRLWVASSDYRVDVRCSDAIFKQLSESYRKIRNTCRILLANLGTPETDFDPAKHMIPVEQMQEIDRYAHPITPAPKQKRIHRTGRPQADRNRETERVCRRESSSIPS